ncbi:MAG: flagellar basal body-associated FliL family protein [Lachnospiraceae bacterium]|nr:flagellar basal body-associated FliL family protein [Lachnospiraceae bacterium]
MKKNLLTIVILALLLVNIALTAVMMISVTSTNSRTAALVDTIATVMSLEVVTDGSAEEAAEAVSMADTSVVALDGSLTIPLKAGEDGKQTYMVCDISLSLNTKHEDYATYSESLSTNFPVIKDKISEVISSHTEEFCKNNREQLKQEILKAIQDLYGSDFIYAVSISEAKFG